ncbi:transposase family protein (plasmid) [Streptomyces clavifer]|uniref:transposase family protein n=1 Tax=Streptomyces clavifer TaxID=68188 RepID=UPI002E810CA1|nr:transposase family protein [Streptomyces clavifer]WUC32499.1 transposase family protein [Streptomyces clavifer]
MPKPGVRLPADRTPGLLKHCASTTRTTCCGRHPQRVRPPGRRTRRLRPQTPAPRRGRADRHRSPRPSFCGSRRPCRAALRTDRRAHPPHHPNPRAPGRPDRRRGELPPTERTLNRALARARATVERGVARLKPYRILYRSRRGPSRRMDIAATAPALERRCRKGSMDPSRRRHR